MAALQNCARIGCPTLEVPNARWWVFWVHANGIASFKLHKPGECIFPADSLLCGEACLTRVLAVHMAEEQNRARQAEMEQQFLQAIERDF